MLLQAPTLLHSLPSSFPSSSFQYAGLLGFQQSVLHGRAFKWGLQQSLPAYGEAFKWSQDAHLHQEVVALQGGMLHVRRAAALALPALAPAGEYNGDSKSVQYELPAINCHFSVKCHPDYECVRDECDAWTLSLFDPPLRTQDPQHALYVSGHYCLFTSLIYPSTPSRRRLVLVTKFTNWFFILDDILEHAHKHIAMELFIGLESIFTSSFDRSCLLELTKIACSPFPASSSLRNNNTPPPPSTGRVTAFLERFRREVWDEMCSDMTPSFKFKVAAVILRSLNGMREHVSMQQKAKLNVTYTFNELMEVRLQDAYAKVYLNVLMEYVLEIELKDIYKRKHDEIADMHVKVEELTLAVAKQAIWTNDMCSFRKEIFKGERLSIMGLLLSERGIHMGDWQVSGRSDDLQASGRSDINDVVQEVINEVWGMIKEQERIAVRLLEEIKHAPGSNLPGHRELVLYSEAMCSGMAGNMYWSTLTSRYNGLHPLPWNTPTLLSFSSPLDHTLDFLHSTVEVGAN